MTARPPRRRSARPSSGGPAGPLAFVLGIVVVLVVAVVVAQPILASTVTGIAEDRPGLLRTPQVRDLIRSSLGDAATIPADPNAQYQSFIVAKGDTAATVARRLAQAGIISRPIVFLLAIYDAGAEEAMQAGTYRVSASMRPADVAKLFQHAYGDQLVLRVGEGWRLSEIAAEVEKRFSKIKADDFTKTAVVGAYGYDFLKGVPNGTPLEGFLYPETYFFAPDITADGIVRTLLDMFQLRSAQAVSAAAQQRKVRPIDIVIIASIVEREARDRKESPTIASVYWNRVAIGMALQADPTVQYALGHWRQLTLEDLKVKSPYNTYANPGLPPTPIAAAGDAAIAGAAQPAQTDYLFFVAKCDGSGDHAFAKTLAEHEQNVKKCAN